MFFFSKFRATASRKVESRSDFWLLELQDAVLPLPSFDYVLLGNFSSVFLYHTGTRETKALINALESLEDANLTPWSLKYIKHKVLPGVI